MVVFVIRCYRLLRPIHYIFGTCAIQSKKLYSFTHFTYTNFKYTNTEDLLFTHKNGFIFCILEFHSVLYNKRCNMYIGEQQFHLHFPQQHSHFDVSKQLSIIKSSKRRLINNIPHALKIKWNKKKLEQKLFSSCEQSILGNIFVKHQPMFVSFVFE